MSGLTPVLRISISARQTNNGGLDEADEGQFSEIRLVTWLPFLFYHKIGAGKSYS